MLVSVTMVTPPAASACLAWSQISGPGAKVRVSANEKSAVVWMTRLTTESVLGSIWSIFSPSSAVMVAMDLVSMSLGLPATVLLRSAVLLVSLMFSSIV